MIPYGRQDIDEDDIAAVSQSLRSNWLTQGPAVAEFETGLAQCCQANAAVACNSGTAALHMAYQAAGIGPGSIVVVPANTFLATANAAIYLGAEVRFCDVDPVTGLMTTDTLAPVLDHQVSAVVPVHFAGQPCDMQALSQLIQAKAPQATLIEDASHALGGLYPSGEPVGKPRYASMITFSFHPVKHIAAGEGGAVMVNDPTLKEKLQRFRSHGMTKDPNSLTRPNEGPWYYEMHSPGFNYRICDFACALASSQLKKLDRFVARRRQIAKSYLEALSDLQHVQLPSMAELNTSAWHLFCLHVDFAKLGKSRQELMLQLNQRDVASQVHYFPVSLQPFYQNRYQTNPSQFPGAVQHYDRALSIPMFPAMTDADIDTVIEAVRQTCQSSVTVRRSQAA